MLENEHFEVGRFSEKKVPVTNIADFGLGYDVLGIVYIYFVNLSVRSLPR